MLNICCKWKADLAHFPQETLILCSRWFDRIHTVLQRIEANLPARLMEPSVVFQDAWGKTMAVPLQICQNFKVIFLQFLNSTIADATVAVPPRIHWYPV